MKACVAILFLTASVPGALGQASAGSVGVAPAPTERRIRAAEEQIQKEPGKYQGYDDLAYHLAQRAEETSDTSYYRQAEQVLAKSFQIAPGNYQGEKVELLVLLGEHEYPKALAEAKALNHQMPDDVLVWGYLADAEMALGDYDGAEKAAQWMINLRPDNVPGLRGGASLRAVWGDTEGAMEFLNQALQETPPFESGDVASILTRMADLQLGIGQISAAEKLDTQALNALPGYYAALENLARVRAAQQRCAEAVELLQKRNAQAPNAASQYALARAFERAGRAAEAKQAYARFEAQARREINQPGNANRELVFYYVDHVPNPAEALRLARLEAARRHDVYTLDAYAWALYANGDYAGARGLIAAVLAVGLRDASIYYHAGAISAKLGDRAAAAKYLRQSLDLNPMSSVAPASRQALVALAPALASAPAAAGATPTGRF